MIWIGAALVFFTGWTVGYITRVFIEENGTGKTINVEQQTCPKCEKLFWAMEQEVLCPVCTENERNE